jgi:hypothetical protein
VTDLTDHSGACLYPKLPREGPQSRPHWHKARPCRLERLPRKHKTLSSSPKYSQKRKEISFRVGTPVPLPPKKSGNTLLSQGSKRFPMAYQDWFLPTWHNSIIHQINIKKYTKQSHNNAGKIWLSTYSVWVLSAFHAINLTSQLCEIGSVIVISQMKYPRYKGRIQKRCFPEFESK